MKRVIVTASHHRMADGLKETLNFITGGLTEVVSLSAYVDNRPVEEEIDELMNGFADEDEVVVLTDLTSGSVNQKFFKYRNRPHTHSISGMNLPLAVTAAMEPQDDYISTERMAQIVEEARMEIKYINAIADDGDDEDE